MSTIAVGFRWIARKRSRKTVVKRIRTESLSTIADGFKKTALFLALHHTLCDRLTRRLIASNRCLRRLFEGPAAPRRQITAPFISRTPCLFTCTKERNRKYNTFMQWPLIFADQPNAGVLEQDLNVDDGGIERRSARMGPIRHSAANAVPRPEVREPSQHRRTENEN